MDRISEDILLVLFSFLDIFDLHEASLVCRQWHRIANDLSLWRVVDLQEIALTHKQTIASRDGLCNLLRSSCTTFRIFNSDSVGSVLSLLPHRCPRLLHLHLAFNKGLNEDDLSLILTRCTLQTLSLSGCSGLLTDSIFSSIQPSRLSSIVNLNLAHLTHLSNESLEIVSRYCSNLQKLDIDGLYHITTPALVNLAISRGAGLRELTFDGSNIGDSALIAIADNARNLTILSVSFCNDFTDQGLESVSQLHELRYLRLRKGANFTNQGFVRLFSAPTIFENVLALDFSECVHLYDEALTRIAGRCHNLRTFMVSWCWELGAAVSALIASNPHLQVLDLTGVKRLDTAHLVDIPQSLPSLRVLIFE